MLWWTEPVWWMTTEPYSLLGWCVLWCAFSLRGRPPQSYQLSNAGRGCITAVLHVCKKEVCLRLICVLVKSDMNCSAVSTRPFMSKLPVGGYNGQGLEGFDTICASAPACTIVGVHKELLPCICCLLTNIIHNDWDCGFAGKLEKVLWRGLVVHAVGIVSTEES